MAKYNNVVFLKPYEKSLKAIRGNKKVLKVIEAFIDHKEQSPAGNMDRNDSALAGGDLKSVGARHYDIGREYRLFYVFKNGKVYLFELTTHEETGTGTPPKQGKQKAYAGRIQNAMTMTESYAGAVADLSADMLREVFSALNEDAVESTMTFDDWLAEARTQVLP